MYTHTAIASMKADLIGVHHLPNTTVPRNGSQNFKILESRNSEVLSVSFECEGIIAKSHSSDLGKSSVEDDQDSDEEEDLEVLFYNQLNA